MTRTTGFEGPRMPCASAHRGQAPASGRTPKQHANSRVAMAGRSPSADGKRLPRGSEPGKWQKS